MIEIAGHSVSSALGRMARLVRDVGVKKTIGVFFSIVEDYYLRSFDRIYGVHTGGRISLETTSVDGATAARATEYAPVNAWAFRRLLRTLGLPRNLRFADVGCGLGRACLVASEYGFVQVTGIDIVSEFCEIARKNAAGFRSKVKRASPVDIINMDALEYSRTTDDDVFFMYKPFSSSSRFLEVVLDNLARRAGQRGRELTVIYSERLRIPESDAGTFKGRPGFIPRLSRRWMGQAFWVYLCRKSDIDENTSFTMY